METRLQPLRFLYRQKLFYQLGTKLITSSLTKVTIIALSFTLETPIQLHANQGKQIVALKSFQLIKTHGGRVRNIELGLSITDKLGANVLLQMNCYSFSPLILFNFCVFFFLISIFLVCVAFTIKTSENRLELLRNQHTIQAVFINITMCDMLIYDQFFFSFGKQLLSNQWI